jgi:hypothetical protein
VPAGAAGVRDVRATESETVARAGHREANMQPGRSDGHVAGDAPARAATTGAGGGPSARKLTTATRGDRELCLDGAVGGAPGRDAGGRPSDARPAADTPAVRANGDVPGAAGLPFDFGVSTHARAVSCPGHPREAATLNGPQLGTNGEPAACAGEARARRHDAACDHLDPRPQVDPRAVAGLAAPSIRPRRFNFHRDGNTSRAGGGFIARAPPYEARAGP